MGTKPDTSFFDQQETQLILAVSAAADLVDRRLKQGIDTTITAPVYAIDRRQEPENKRIETLLQDILTIMEEIHGNVVKVENEGKTHELCMSVENNKVVLDITTDPRGPVKRALFGKFGEQPTTEFLHLSETGFMFGFKKDENKGKRELEYKIGSYQTIHGFLLKFFNLLEKFHQVWRRQKQ